MRKCLLLLLLAPLPAYAYLDPGTGSLLLQGLIGGLAAAAGVMSLYWNKVKEKFVRKKAAKTVDDA